MSKSFKYNSDQEQQNKQANKAKKFSKQQLGRMEKALLRSTGVDL